MIYQINILGKINAYTFRTIKKELMSLYLKPSKILLNINSTGGIMSQSILINKFWEKYCFENKIKIYTFCEDYCLGSSIFLFLLGNKRYSFNTSLFGNIDTNLLYFNINNFLKSQDVELLNYNKQNFNNIFLESNKDEYYNKYKNSIPILKSKITEKLRKNLSEEIINELFSKTLNGKRAIDLNLVNDNLSIYDFTTSNYPNERIKLITNNNIKEKISSLYDRL